MALAEDRSEHSVALRHSYHCAVGFSDIGGNSSHQKLDIGAPRTARDARRFLPCKVFAQGIGTEFLAHREKIEVTRHNSTCELSPVPLGRAHRPTGGLFRRVKGISPGDRDWVAERRGFEPPVPTSL
jgi:hypothetical protein